MIESTAQSCLRAIGGELLRGNEDYPFQGVSIDSRTLRSGELFFCIRGEHFDGHDFLEDVISKKAAGIVLSNKEKLPASPPTSGKANTPFVIRVSDTLTALQELAHFHRNRFPVRVVGITGTNGKSTTKEMVASITETRFRTLKTEGNLNNHIGLPLTLMGLDPADEVAVLEMGMSAAGEIRRLAEIAQPQVGVITNISEGHLVQLRTLKNVQAAKGELYDALTEQGTAIVNADDPLVLELAQSARARVVTFGINNPADVRARDIRARANNGFDFTINLFEQEIPLYLPFLGECNIYNALAAVATGHSLGVPAENLSTGLGNCRLMSQRYEIFEHDSVTIINDSYNANPRSMSEALRTLIRFETSGRRFFVIGEMRELGDLSETAHTALGTEIAGQNVDGLVTVGPLAALAAQSAVETGMNPDAVAIVDSQGEAVDYLKEHLRPGDSLLIKGSRGAHMEEVVDGLLKVRL